MSSLDTEQTNDPLRGECERKVLFPIVLFLIVLSPLFIPVGVSVVGGFDDWRSRRAVRPVRQFRPVREFHPVREFRPAAGLMPVAA
ncbi:MAG: hypothetical protein QOG23_5943 [Blastocatellia bacterium]|jgi:hypothetical protein|nr:hypothetical protein [Blastocatellia bacterium]